MSSAFEAGDIAVGVVGGIPLLGDGRVKGSPPGL